MTLLGGVNWWIPRRLDRLSPTVGVEGEAGLPEPELEADAGRARRRM